MEFEPSDREHAIVEAAARVARPEGGTFRQAILSAASGSVGRAFLGSGEERTTVGYFLALTELADRDPALALSLHGHLVFCDAAGAADDSGSAIDESDSIAKLGCIGCGPVDATNRGRSAKLNGHLNLITNAEIADQMLLLPEISAISASPPLAFLIEASEPHVVCEPAEVPAALGGLPCAHVRVAEATAQRTITGHTVRQRYWSACRLGIAAVTLGMWKSCFRASLERLGVATTNSKPPGIRQAGHFALSDMATDFDAARLLALRAAAARDETQSYGTLAAEAKWLTCSGAARAATGLLQMAGASSASGSGKELLEAVHFLDTMATNQFTDIDRIARGLLEESRE